MHAENVNHQDHEGPAGAQACGSLSERQTPYKKQGRGATSARKAEIKIAAQQQHYHKTLQQQEAKNNN